ncbi:MAG TPA: hypothetical protein VIV40_30220, partial [Kofleriaceae bacterium]
GEEGVEVIACTRHKLRGVAEFEVGQLPLQSYRFGDDEPIDNGRCLASPIATVASASTNSSSTASATPAGSDATRAQPVLVEQPYTGSETPFADELCKQYGLEPQTIMMSTVTRTEPGVDLHVKLWSDVPNDLEGAIFLVRHLTSKKSKADVDKEWAKLERDAAKHPQQAPAPHPKPQPQHGPPPAPLAEARSAQPTANARWIAGYWQWTGAQWGWVAGFWRDERVAMPAPRVEVPGALPSAAAVWVGGVWQLRGGGWIWIEGHWR